MLVVVVSVVVEPAEGLAGLAAHEAVQIALLHEVVVNVVAQSVEDCFQLSPRLQIYLLHWQGIP